MPTDADNHPIRKAQADFEHNSYLQLKLSPDCTDTKLLGSRFSVLCEMAIREITDQVQQTEPIAFKSCAGMERIIEECRPPICFGEQVASKAGRAWLAGVFADLEALDYAAAGADLCAASVGAPNERQRLWWVADSKNNGTSEDIRARESHSEWRGATRRLGDAESGDGRLPILERRSFQAGSEFERHGQVDFVGDTASAGPQGQWSEYRPSGEGSGGLVGLAMQTGVPQWNGPTLAVRCTDGARRASAESGAFPLAYGLSARVVRLRGYGNAINPIVAATFIQAYLEAITP